MHDVKVGQIITGPARRDAIHVPVLPSLAIRVMYPGEKLKNGVVDPFLEKPVQPGERYWVFIYPGTVKTLRHCWSHDAFAEEQPYSDEDPAADAGMALGGPRVMRAIERDERDPAPEETG